MIRSHCGFRPALALSATLLLLSACASSPIHLYTLSGGAPADDAAARSGSPPFAIVLEPVSVTRSADIPQLVIAGSDGRSHLTEDHRWRAPLPDEIGAALAQQLQDRFGVSDFSRVAAPEGLALFRVRVDVQRFESLPAGQALVWAAWSLRAADSKSAALACVSQFQQASAGDHAALVSAYRTAIAGLATQIGRALEGLARTPAATTCPAAGV